MRARGLGVVADELATREEMAAIMRVSIPTIDRMLRDGMRDAAAVSWGRRLVRIRVSAAMRWAEQQEGTSGDQ